MKQIFTPKINGFIVPNITAMTIIGLDKWLSPEPGILIYSEFVIIPFLMGIISAWFWRNQVLSSRIKLGYACINVFLAILLSYIFLGEGIICLVIVSPLLFCFITGGLYLGKKMFIKNDRNFNVSFIALLIMVFITDSLSVHHYENMVSDQVIINAPVNVVWNNVVAFKRIKEENKYWLFRIGMPSPIESTVEGYYLGANRKCIFSNGYVFDEKIVTYDINKNLTFDVTNQPRDPEIMGHIDILKGQFILKDNGNGTTLLTGNSWYRLHVFPIWYYDIWAKSITRNVHLRVMEHIKQLSEAR